MSSLRLFGALSKISKTNIKFTTTVPLRCMSIQENKHVQLKVVDNVGVIVLDSAGAKYIKGVEWKHK